MSEFSTSYHIRTENSPATEQKLASAGHEGLLFGPGQGWLTFVPFGHVLDSEGYAVQLANTLIELVLAYDYAEDHGWSFAFVRHGQPTSAYGSSWDAMFKEDDRSRLDLTAFEGIADAALLAAVLEPHTEEDFRNPKAYRFAKLVGLPAYIDLSPTLAVEGKDYYLERGARLLTR